MIYVVLISNEEYNCFYYRYCIFNRKKRLNLEKSILTVLSSSMAQIKNLEASGSGVFHCSTVFRRAILTLVFHRII